MIGTVEHPDRSGADMVLYYFSSLDEAVFTPFSPGVSGFIGPEPQGWHFPSLSCRSVGCCDPR